MPRSSTCRGWYRPRSRFRTFSISAESIRLLGIYEEDGGVFISTNRSVPPSINMPLVHEYAGEVADTWQRETLDLTPWVGMTIQVVFYYQGVNLGNTPYGWTIDDIGITGVLASGNITVTKNLGQGTWSLSSISPIGTVPVKSGSAPSVTLSNMAAGKYVVEFSDVPFFQTPADETNTLSVGGSLNFSGNYAFIDANHNGISDAWEQNYFGTVVTNRTQTTDTDRDGMSDYAEFIAGTDLPMQHRGFISTASLGPATVL